MPKTIVYTRTFICPTGKGDKAASCRFHRADDNLPSDGKCPKCKLELVEATDLFDMITMTVIGDEDIEEEIIEKDEVAHRNRRMTEVDGWITQRDNDGEFATPVAKAKARALRQEDIDLKVSRLKARGYFLTTPAEKDAYRAQRRAEKDAAIQAARLKEKK